MRRKGFVMIYALSAILITSLLAAGAASAIRYALSLERERERGLDEVLIAQDVMEREKYNRRFSASEPSLGNEIERNGRRYEVEVNRRLRVVEGIPMVEISCTVKSAGEEGIRLATLMEGEL